MRGTTPNVSPGFCFAQFGLRLLDVWREDRPADVALMSRALMGCISLWLKARGVSCVG